MAAATGNIDDALGEYREAFRITEDLVTDTVSLREKAKVCAKLGEIHITLASNTGDTREPAKGCMERSAELV